MKIRKLMKKIGDASDKAVDSIKNFKEQPLKSSGELLPVAMVLVGIIGFIFAFLKFVSEKGYGRQIQILQADFFEGIEDVFTTGTVNVLTTGTVSTIILLLLLAEFIVMLISFYKTESKIKKIVASVCLGLGVAIFGTAGFVLAVGYDIINFSYETEVKILSVLTMFDGAEVSRVLTCFQVVTFVGFAALAVFVILMLFSPYLWMLKKSVIALGITYIIFPLLLLASENIVPLIAGVFALILFGLFAVLGIKMITSGGEGEVSASNYKKNEFRKKEETMKTDKCDVKYWNIERDAQLWVESNFHGAKLIRAYGRTTFGNEYKDPITYSLVGDPSLHDFVTGKVIINIKGKRMTEKDLHYKNK